MTGAFMRHMGLEPKGGPIPIPHSDDPTPDWPVWTPKRLRKAKRKGLKNSRQAPSLALAKAA